MTVKRLKIALSHVLAWLNFGLLIAAGLKFLPLLYSLSHGFDLQYLPSDDARHLQRAWALDLVSDTGFLLLVWFLTGHFNRFLVGDWRLIPWRSSPTMGSKPDGIE